MKKKVYKGIVRYNGNHYTSGYDVIGSKVRYNENGTVEIFDDEPDTNFYGITEDVWVEVFPDSVKEIENENPYYYE